MVWGQNRPKIWGLRMVETTCKEQFIETATKMEPWLDRLPLSN
jgi:hypothetical protein